MESIGSHFKIERAVAVEVKKLIPNRWNIQVTNHEEQKAIAGSLKLFGQVEELLVRHHPDLPGFYEIISGEHRARELTELTGEVYVNIIHGLSNAEAKQLSVIMNNTHGQSAEADLVKLLGEIALGMSKEAIVSTLPISQDYLETLLQQAQSLDSQISKRSNTQESGESWITLKVKVPSSALPVIQEARRAVEAIRGGLHENDAVAWGIVLEALAAEVIA